MNDLIRKLVACSDDRHTEQAEKIALELNDYIANISVYSLDKETITMPKSQYDKFERELMALNKALTPPTADEVCEAFGKHFRAEIYYDGVGKFYHMRYTRMQFNISYLNEDGNVVFNYDLPPHLITLIGRFYEGVEKVGKEE